MAHVPEVQTVEVLRFQDADGARLFVHVMGSVDSAGWSRLGLRPRFYALPPADGLWEFDFEGDPPEGAALVLALPVTAETTVAVPGWLCGVKVYAATGSQSSTTITSAVLSRTAGRPVVPAVPADTCILRSVLASYSDRIRPVRTPAPDGLPRTKALHHELLLTLAGPDESRIHRCLAAITSLGLVDAVAAAYSRSGGLLFIAVAALLVHSRDDLGDAYQIRVDDLSNWVDCTR